MYLFCGRVESARLIEGDVRETMRRASNALERGKAVNMIGLDVEHQSYTLYINVHGSTKEFCTGSESMTRERARAHAAI